MKRLHAFLWFAALAMVIMGCGKGSSSLSEEAFTLADRGPLAAAQAAPSAMDGAAMGEARMTEAASPALASAPPEAAALVETARIIRSASIALEVDGIPEAEARVRELVESAEGYIADSRINYSEGYGAGGTMTARVPAERYSETYASLRGGTYGYLITSWEQTQDVTEEWVDTESRIRVLEGERDTLGELLARRGELGEILEVQREILNVQMQIEQSQGRLNVLRNRVSLSTITIELRLRADESDLAQAERERDKWRPGYVFRRSFSGMVRSLQSLVNSLIVILTYIPCWGPVALALWLLSRKLRGSAAERKKWRDVEEEKRQRAWEDYQQARDTSGETAPPPDDEVDTE
ncbi:MAG: DUF4349 domain-containing protein [Armatimonadetes bacterium]|jgi:hypothetical protein|nr:DUF4349 domain-containing protein [Armatimonadota bacterium]